MGIVQRDWRVEGSNQHNTGIQRTNDDIFIANELLITLPFGINVRENVSFILQTDRTSHCYTKWNLGCSEINPLRTQTCITHHINNTNITLNNSPSLAAVNIFWCTYINHSCCKHVTLFNVASDQNHYQCSTTLEKNTFPSHHRILSNVPDLFSEDRLLFLCSRSHVERSTPGTSDKSLKTLNQWFIKRSQVPLKLAPQPAPIIFLVNRIMHTSPNKKFKNWHSLHSVSPTTVANHDNRMNFTTPFVKYRT